jgi:hypothetical protein
MIERQKRNFFSKRFNGNLASWLAEKSDLAKHFSQKCANKFDKFFYPNQSQFGLLFFDLNLTIFVKMIERQH